MCVHVSIDMVDGITIYCQSYHNMKCVAIPLDYSIINLNNTF